MVSADVGFQCIDCVRQSSPPHKAVSPLTVAGGKHVGTAWVTWTIVAVCVVIYLGESIIGIAPSAVAYGMVPLAIAIDDQWWRLITAAFLHGSLLHIGFNMLVLASVGPTMERILGHGRYLVLYLVAALGGSIASYCFSSPATVSVGASGAIFGLLGALLVAGRRLRFDITQVLILIGINLAIGFIPGTGIDWRAHAGGLVAGAAVTAVMVHPPQRNRMLVQVVGVAVILVVLVGAGLVRTSMLRDLYHNEVANPTAVAAKPSGTMKINDHSLDSLGDGNAIATVVNQIGRPL